MVYIGVLHAEQKLVIDVRFTNVRVGILLAKIVNTTQSLSHNIKLLGDENESLKGKLAAIQMMASSVFNSLKIPIPINITN